MDLSRGKLERRFARARNPSDSPLAAIIRPTATRSILLISAASQVSCSGIQSSLAPAGESAEGIAALFWWMAGGSVVVWAAVLALAFYYVRHATNRNDRRRDRLLIAGGGVLLPGLVLTVLLVFGLAMIPPAVARAPEGSLTVDVTSELWWWRVRYLQPAGDVTLANEIRLPVGEPVQFRLSSDNVIHSFWIPALAGKMDMIPGRITWLTVRPTRTGVFRGQCAEFCGTSHALMAFYVVVMEKPAFERWLAGQAEPAAAASTTGAGPERFLANGCGACHTIRGTPANGVIGPDLTHVASRLSIGAGILPADHDAFVRWIARTHDIKPEAQMPAFGMLPEEDLEGLAAYLGGLR